MATQDDKISNNRRRLFKALSAAPVVATLKPGEALAALSSYQCAANLRDDLTLSTGPEVVESDDNCYTGPDNFCYEPRVVFEFAGPLLDSGGSAVDTTGVDITPSFTVVYADEVPADPGTITETSGAFLLVNEGGGAFATDGETLISNLSGGAYFSVAGGVMTIFNAGLVACYEATYVVKGLAIVGYTTSDGAVDDRYFKIQGVYPEGDTTDVVLNGGSAGDYQGITGTCLGSIPVTASLAKRRTLTIG